MTTLSQSGFGLLHLAAVLLDRQQRLAASSARWQRASRLANACAAGGLGYDLGLALLAAPSPPPHLMGLLRALVATAFLAGWLCRRRAAAQAELQAVVAFQLRPSTAEGLAELERRLAANALSGRLQADIGAARAAQSGDLYLCQLSAAGEILATLEALAAFPARSQAFAARKEPHATH